MKQSTISIGNKGELIAIQYFLDRDEEVFRSVFDNSSCDLIVIREGIPLRVEVKTTTNLTNSGKYEVGLRSTRPRCLGNTVKSFDSSKSDILIVVVLPTKKVHELKSEDFDGKYSVRVCG